MRELFRGWSKKAGCITLLVACVFTAGWMRSRITYDLISFKIGERTQMIHVTNGHVYWWGVSALNGRLNWESKPPPPALAIDEERGYWSDDEGWNWNFREWIVPHFPVAISLSILSAYLILWHPQKRAEPCPD